MTETTIKLLLEPESSKIDNNNEDRVSVTTQSLDRSNSIDGREESQSSSSTASLSSLLLKDKSINQENDDHADLSNHNENEKGDTPISSLTKILTPIQPSSNLLKIVTAARDNAQPKSIGKCAQYVRKALKEGGVQPPTIPASAYMYKEVLPEMGWQLVSEGPISSEPRLGQIMIWDKTKSTPHGHIQIYDGKNWVSDFVQNSWIPGSKYQNTMSVSNPRLYEPDLSSV